MQTVTDIVLKAVRFIPIAIAVASCAPAPAPTSEDHLLTSYRQFNESYQAKFAELDAIVKCQKDYLQRVKKSSESKDPAAMHQAINEPDNCPPKPKGIRQDENIADYADRLKDEWQEGDCSYQARFRARSSAELEYIKSQCLRDLELIRIRKALEKANKK